MVFFPQLFAFSYVGSRLYKSSRLLDHGRHLDRDFFRHHAHIQFESRRKCFVNEEEEDVFGFAGRSFDDS